MLNGCQHFKVSNSDYMYILFQTHSPLLILWSRLGFRGKCLPSFTSNLKYGFLLRIHKEEDTANGVPDIDDGTVSEIECCRIMKHHALYLVSVGR